jgi:hypothetical protein
MATTTRSSKRPARSSKKKEESATAVVAEVVAAPAAAEPAPAKPARKRAAAAVAKPAAPQAAPVAVAAKKPAARKKTVKPEIIEAEPAVAPEPAAEAPAKPSRKRAAAKIEKAEKAVELAEAPAKKKPAAKKKAKPAEPAPPPAEPPRYSLGSREDEGTVFGDHELLDRELGTSYRLRLLGPLAWRCDCEQHRLQADCEHGEALLSLLPLEQIAQLDAGWPAREAEVWLVEQGGERRLQWVAGLAVPAALNELARPKLDEALRLPAEQAHGWLQALLDAARTAGVPLRIAPEVWAQLAAARDAQARVQRLEPLLQEPGALAALLKEPLPAYQWEAALFAVCAGRALIADDLGLGQRGAALAAIALWVRLFGVEPALVIAPAAAQEAWRRDIQRLLGDWPAQLTLAEQPPTGGRTLRPQLLVVDALDGLDEAALAALRALEAPQLLLISEREPLGDARLAAWVDWLDAQRRGPLARLAALPADASKKAQREALQTVLLSRRKRELQQEQRLPAALLQLALAAARRPGPAAGRAAAAARPGGALAAPAVPVQRGTAAAAAGAGPVAAVLASCADGQGRGAAGAAPGMAAGGRWRRGGAPAGLRPVRDPAGQPGAGAEGAQGGGAAPARRCRPGRGAERLAGAGSGLAAGQRRGARRPCRQPGRAAAGPGACRPALERGPAGAAPAPRLRRDGQRRAGGAAAGRGLAGPRAAERAAGRGRVPGLAGCAAGLAGRGPAGRADAGLAGAARGAVTSGT